MSMPDEELNGGDDDLKAMMRNLMANQERLEDRLAMAQANNDELQAKLAAAEQRKANGEQHHREVPMSDGERWKKMLSGGGLLG